MICDSNIKTRLFAAIIIDICNKSDIPFKITHHTHIWYADICVKWCIYFEPELNRIFWLTRSGVQEAFLEDPNVIDKIRDAITSFKEMNCD